MSGDDLMLFISRWVGVAGLGLLILSGVGGTLLASRIAQKLRFLRGKTFKYHRLGSIVGVTLVALHPVPLLWTGDRTGIDWANAFIPFIAPKDNVWLGLGIIAGYAMMVVLVSSLYIRRLGRTRWRTLHWGSYLVFGLGLVHSLFISTSFLPGETLDLFDFEKLIVIAMCAGALVFPLWRAFVWWKQPWKQQRWVMVPLLSRRLKSL